jgi:hypothetical protein
MRRLQVPADDAAQAPQQGDQNHRANGVGVLHQGQDLKVGRATSRARRRGFKRRSGQLISRPSGTLAVMLDRAAC